MIIWSGWGIIVGLAGVACLVATQLAVTRLMEDEHYYTNHGWPKLLALWLAAAICFPIGRYMNSDGGGHSLFFVPVQYWWAIFLVLGIVVLFV